MDPSLQMWRSWGPNSIGCGIKMGAGIHCGIEGAYAWNRAPSRWSIVGDPFCSIFGGDQEFNLYKQDLVSEVTR